MKACTRLALTLLLGTLFSLIGTQNAGAEIIIYKVTVSSKGQFFPKNAPLGSSQKSTGYLIFNTLAPANSQAVEIFSNKTYVVNGSFLSRIFPAAFGFGVLDKNNDGFGETLNTLIGLQDGNVFHARSVSGTIAKNGFFIKGQLFVGLAKKMKGKGTVVIANNDLLTRSESYTVDDSSAARPTTTDVGRDAIIAMLELKGYNLVAQ